jgi:hypothetical protein
MQEPGICGQPLHGQRMAAPIKDTAWLEWMAGLMGAGARRRASAMLPPHQFHCLLDELPLHLVPAGYLKRARLSGDFSQPVSLNPNCELLSEKRLPAQLQARRDLIEGFNLAGSVAWVHDDATGVVNPFWLGQRLEATISQLSPGEPAPASLPENDRALLTMSGILVPHGHAERRASRWAAIVERRRQAFRENNYVPLSGLIHPFHVAALRRYYRHAIRRGAIRFGDEQSPFRYAAHNEIVARFFHHQLADVVSAIVGEPVKPSYVYFAAYLSGAELKKHTDREQCEFSVTLCLDFSPEPELATSWPLRVSTPQGTVTIYQALGDGLVYRGTRVPHYRDVLAAGHTSTSVFFHYVPENFRGSLH